MNSPHSLSLANTQLPKRLPGRTRWVLNLLQNIQHGRLTLVSPEGELLFFGHGSELHASITLHDWSVLDRALQSGDIGFAECYMEGLWETPDLSQLLKLIIRNQETLDAVVFGHWWGRLIYRFRHWLNRNTKQNAQKNIHAHYDLGNAFYSLWLDKTMSYSSAWFRGDHCESLEEAQLNKIRRALSAVRASPQDRILEIGCGWGGLAEIAAQQFGAYTTGVTLSTEQLEFAQNRLRQKGLSDQTQFRLQDYREVPDAPFDAICSIEMFEAVGRDYWPQYFEHAFRLLKPGKRACIQTIVIHDDQFERYISGTDFIQQYVFPGGCLPSTSEFIRHAEQAGFRVIEVFRFGTDYAETLRRWKKTFLSEIEAIKHLNFDSRFIRLWEFYLSYCEAAFDEGNTDVIQFTLERPAR